ncbi:mitotic apparatus protein p62-like [Telopea speciosissima]|uniref:mitotic apparatus protein p62-like n=1 Tax=Telopea speciosissima TaxID=54955 RepID=UPI001CC750FC|nr:mitotic apparatus protein p62-like [Telopea speciosissima]
MELEQDTKEDEPKESKKKVMAFKSCYEISDDEEELSDDEIAYLSKKFSRFLKNKGKTSFNKRRFAKDQKGKSVSKDNTNCSSKVIIYFECRKPGHYKRDFPKMRKYKKTYKAEHSFDSSDEEKEDEESQEEEQTNLALMALEDEENENEFDIVGQKSSSTPMSTSVKLSKDEDGTLVDPTKYRGTSSIIGLWYPMNNDFDLISFSDADYAKCHVDRKSTSGTCHFLGSCLVYWFSKKQSSVALSTTEAEYIAIG